MPRAEDYEDQLLAELERSLQRTRFLEAQVTRLKLARERISIELGIYHPDLDESREVNERMPAIFRSARVQELRHIWTESNPDLARLDVA